jgi:hypothetical protein
MYQDLIKNNNVNKIETPSTFVPNPNEEDYVDGFIIRYFVQKVNELNGPVYEVSSDTFISLKRNPFWRTAIVDWKIAGSSMTQKNDINLIRKYNRDSILKAKSSIPNISAYLVDLLQFSLNRVSL